MKIDCSLSSAFELEKRRKMLGAMGILKKNVDVFVKSKNWPQIFALFSASLVSITAGAMFTFTSPAIPKLLTDEYKFTLNQVTYLPIIPPIFMVSTAILFSRLADKIGRKYTLLITGVFHISSWLLTAFAKNLYLFYLSRGLLGLGEATIYSSMPAYVAEITTPQMRSLFGNIMTLSGYMGQLLINCVGYYFSIQTTSLLMLASPILFLVTFAFVPESPYYLIMIGDKTAAEKSLQKLRRSQDVSEELQQLTLDVRRQLSESGKVKDLWQIKSNRKSLAIAISIRIFQLFSGATAINIYAQYFFEQMGGSVSSGNAAMILAAEIAVVSILGNIVCDRIGKRKAIIISAFGCGVTLLSEAIFFSLKTYEIVDLSGANWFPLFGIVIFEIMYCTGLGIVPSIILGEMFSTSIKKHATACTIMVFGIAMCLNMKLFDFLLTTFELWVLYLLFSLCCFVSSLLSWFIIPETKGKTLEEIQQMLKGNS